MSVTVWPRLENSSISASDTDQINAVITSFGDSLHPMSFHSLDSDWTDEAVCCELSEFGWVEGIGG
jgi:hypothetical protein